MVEIQPSLLLTAETGVNGYDCILTVKSGKTQLPASFTNNKVCFIERRSLRITSCLHYSTKRHVWTRHNGFTTTQELITGPKNNIYQTQLHVILSTCTPLLYSLLSNSDFSQREK